MIPDDEACINNAIGANLRMLRERFRLSLREVQERSEALATKWGHSEYQISASYLARIEGGRSGMSASKLIVLTALYGLSAHEMLALCSPPGASVVEPEPAAWPNATVLLASGSLEERAKLAISEDVVTAQPPEESRLLTRPEGYPSGYRRGIVGRKDNTMEPMIRAGSIVLIDTQRKAIAKRKDWTHEFNRPIYFLLAHSGYYTGFCELDKKAEWLTLVPHALSYQTNRRWRYRREVEVVGEVTGFIVRRY